MADYTEHAAESHKSKKRIPETINYTESGAILTQEEGNDSHSFNKKKIQQDLLPVKSVPDNKSGLLNSINDKSGDMQLPVTEKKEKHEESKEPSGLAKAGESQPPVDESQEYEAEQEEDDVITDVFSIATETSESNISEVATDLPEVDLAELQSIAVETANLLLSMDIKVSGGKRK